MKYLVLLLALAACQPSAPTPTCSKQVQENFNNTFLQCIDKSHVTDLSGAKYQGWDEVVNECEDAAKHISGIVSYAGFIQCFVSVTNPTNEQEMK